MSKVAFVGFGEVNTPVDVIIKRCGAARSEEHTSELQSQ